MTGAALPVVAAVLPAPRRVANVQHHPTLAIDEAPDWSTALRQRNGARARALELLTLTTVRSSELRGMRWGELNLDSALWVISAERMKPQNGQRKEHRALLPGLAVELLKGRKPENVKPDDLVFAAPRKGQLRGVVEARPDRVEDEVASIADGKDADQAGDAERQCPAALGRRVAPGCGARSDGLDQAHRRHAEAARLDRRHRQRPAAGPPEGDVIHEDLSRRPARADAVVRDDAEGEQDPENEGAEAPFREAGAE